MYPDSSPVVSALAQRPVSSGTTDARCYGTGTTGQAGNWASARVIIFNNAFPRLATSTLNELGTFNKQVPVDVDLGAMGVSVAWTAQLSSPPNFAFE